MVKNAEVKVTADYGHGNVDLEDIGLLAEEKCLAKATHVDARRNSLEKFKRVDFCRCDVSCVRGNERDPCGDDRIR